MSCNIFNVSGNEMYASAIAFGSYLGNIFNAEELAILGAFFNLVGDSLALYATVLPVNNESISNVEDDRKK
ncbi:MAG: hypothetical protein IKV94_02450 [Clostridia bacterium]|nr:hypothetical protein [Clostridia bacterium]